MDGNGVPQSEDLQDAINGKYETSLSLAERTRQREIQSYLLAASITPSTRHLVESDPAEPPKRSIDPSLTALVQLAAFCLDTERAFLSLIDGSTHYIAAEATKHTSLANGGGASAENDLFLGTMRMDKSWGICPKTMDFFCDTTGELRCGDPNIIANNSRYIIKDLVADPELRERPYVVNWPYMRSYLEVPVTSPSGYIIGGLSVIDNKLKTYDNNAVDTLTEIGKTIMSHLDHVRMKNYQARSAQLIKGLDRFIQEETGAQLRKASIIPRQQAEKINGFHNNNSVEIPHAEITALSLSGETASPDTLTPGQGPTVVTNGQRKDPTLSTEIRTSFARSAALIRESLMMDGMVFLDASLLSATSRANHQAERQNNHVTPEHASNTSDSTNSCPILGVSGGVGCPADIAIPQDLLGRLANQFPRGRIFLADQYGVLSGPSTPTSSSSYAAHLFNVSADEDRRADVHALFTYLPGATSAIFLPMWHFQKERWFAAGIGWTCDSTFSFDSCDATYVSAFGNSIMTEVLRHEALAVSNAKSDFISSISHEIRSPLHGILATTELLNDTVRPSEERAMLAMIQSCGTTLLDTMNHLLEFAKINNLSQSKSRNRQEENGIAGMADLGRLVEDVTENVSAGYAFETSPQRHGIPEQNMASTPANENGPALPVLVILDIQPSPHWYMPLDVGAWKRVVMNLVGNALKYTSQGYITVSLAVDGDHIRLSVKDTGIGIGDDYLKYKLFTPFTQENTFSSGTGLGLAIVQQIVRNLGGTLEVQSQVGVGTLVSVIVPLQSSATPQQNGISRALPALGGRSLCFLRATDLSRYAFDPECQAYAKRLETSVESTAVTWLGMEVRFATSVEEMAADIYVIDCSLEVSPDTAIPTTLYGKPVVVITGSRSRHQSLGPGLVFLRTPFGPRQLAIAISGAIESAKQENQHLQISKTARFARSQPQAVTANANNANEATAQPTSPLIPTFTGKSGPKADNPQTQPSSAPSHHVLVVDDNAINVKILTKLLDGLGHPYTTAMNGIEAVQAYTRRSSEQPFTLVFMDVSMPLMNGFDATREIRQYEKERGVASVRIIALTGLGDESSEAQAFACGMDEFWIKPVKLGKVKKLLVKAGDNG